MKHLALILIFASVAWGQFPPGSSAAKRISAEGDSLPATCDTRDLFLRTGSTAPGVYGCTAPNTWTGPASVTGGDGDVVGTTSASNPDGACTAGKAIHVNTATSRMFVCGPANNQWIAVDTGVATSLSAPYVDWNAGSGGASILNKPSLGTAAAATLGTGAGQVPVTGDYQPLDSDLTAIAALACEENEIMKRNGSNTWICATDATGGGGTIEIQNNAGTKEGDFSIVRLTNGTGTTWSITDAGGGRANIAPNVDTTTFLQLTGAQTRGPGLTVEQLSIGTTYQTMRKANAGTTGTTLNYLAKIDSSGNAVLSGTSDTGIPLWVVAAGAGTTGNAELVTGGRVQLYINTSCGRGDFVVQSPAVAGRGRCRTTPDDGEFVHGVADETTGSEGLTYIIAHPSWRWGSGGGMTNPMTTAGDIIIGGTSGAPTRLAADDNGKVLKLIAGAPAWAAEKTFIRQLGAEFKSPAAEQVQYFRVPQACTITGWQMMAAGGTSPTATADVWLIASGTALPTVSNTITASAKPALATGNAIESTTLTGWTTSVTAGMIGAVKLDAVSGSPTMLQVTVYCQQ